MDVSFDTTLETKIEKNLKHLFNNLFKITIHLLYNNIYDIFLLNVYWFLKNLVDKITLPVLFPQDIGKTKTKTKNLFLSCFSFPLTHYHTHNSPDTTFFPMPCNSL